MTGRGAGVVVIGGSGGIGRAVVEGFLARGAPVVFTYYENTQAAAEIVERASRIGAVATPLRLRIQSRDSGETLLQYSLRHLDSIEGLVNCAGTNIRQRLEEVSPRTWSEVQDVNLFGTFTTCRTVGLHMFTEQGHGAIVNISSTASVRPLSRSPHYVAAQAGVVGLTRFLAATLAPRVVVNAVLPGFILTDRKRFDDEIDYLAKVPLERFGNAEDVARLVLFLTEPGSYVTGQVIAVDGGLTL